MGATYLEEEPDNEDLESAHAHYQPALDEAEVEYALLCAPHGAEVPVLAGPEVFLVPHDRRQLAVELQDRLLQRRRLLWGGALLLRQRDAGFVLDLQ